MFLGIFPLLHCNARRRTNTIHLFAKKCVRRILNLLPCRLSCPYGVCKTPPLWFATQDIGEVSRSDGGVKFYNQNPIRRLSNPSPQKLPFLRSLPYILHCKTQGRRCNTNIGYPFLPLPYPVALRGTAHKIEAEAKEKYISTSPLAVSRSIVGHGKEGGFN